MAMARWMGSPRHANRRWRTREFPEPACVLTPFLRGVAHAGGDGRINVLLWYRSVVGLPARVSGRQVQAGRPALDLGFGQSSKTAPGYLLTGSPSVALLRTEIAPCAVRPT